MYQGKGTLVTLIMKCVIGCKSDHALYHKKGCCGGYDGIPDPVCGLVPDGLTQKFRRKSLRC